MKLAGKLAILLGLLANAQAQPVVRQFDATPRSVTAGKPVVLSWQVDKAKEIRIEPGLGSVSRKGSLTVAPINDVTYTLKAIDSAGVVREATVTVTVTPTPTAAAPNREMGLARVTGRHLLPTGVAEARGFGLYSYLLFGENETERNRDRYLAILRQVLIEVSSLTEILANKPDLKRVNILYIPVRSALETSEASPAAEAERILKNYDFARAKLLLASIGDNYLKGPYFVSRLTPILQSNEVGPPYLFQDLSRADPSLASDWVGRFLRQAARENPWDENSVARFAMGLRNEIQVLANFAVPVSWNNPR